MASPSPTSRWPELSPAALSPLVSPRCDPVLFSSRFHGNLSVCACVGSCCELGLFAFFFLSAGFIHALASVSLFCYSPRMLRMDLLSLLCARDRMFSSGLRQICEMNHFGAMI